MKLARVPTADPVQALDDLIGLMTSASAEMLQTVAVFDRQRRWERDGATCMTSWLAARYGLSGATATEWVRVAHALESLPHIARAYAEARMSWDQLRPLTRFATAENDACWAGKACSLRPRTLQREAMRHERVQRRDAEEARKRRSVSWFWDREGSAPVLYLSGALPGAQGAAFEQSLRHRALAVEVEADVVDPRGARRADALVAAVTASGDRAAPMPSLMVHVDAASLAGAEPEDGPILCETTSGVRLEGEAVRRFLADSSVQAVVEREGRPVGVGRRSRKAPEWLKELVEFRDEGCVFPGCERKGYSKQHHIRWWAGGGGTDLDNLVTLCDAHHRLVHERGWTIRGHPDDGLHFYDPGGTPLIDRPPGIRPEIRERYFP